ncbi:hypothetical protein B0H11DRAFT_2251478 [Mycena galericulata]|nr:hypothetical protein B0H11DRAFT_2251478 [Mycena galericulata]
MDSQAPDVLESVSAVGTQYYSAPVNAGPGPSDARRSTPVDDVATAMSPDRVQRLTIHLDERGIPYLLDGDGNQVATSDSISTQHLARARSVSTEAGDNAEGVPMHHSALFPEQQSAEPSSESGVSDSIPTGAPRGGLSAIESPANLPTLGLGIDPMGATANDVSHLNAVRGHLGAANARLLATTAIVAEQQATTEELQESIYSTRVEVLSRLDSLRNEVTSQRARISRCLDDNLRVLQETGASSSQINDILNTIRENGGSPRQERPIPPHLDTPTSTPSAIIPESVQTAANAVISPRAASESSESFLKRADATMRTKNQTLSAFPLPTTGVSNNPVGASPSAPAPAMAPKFTMLNEARAAGRFEMPLDHCKLATENGNVRVERMLNAAQPSVRRVQMTSASNARGVPAGMNNSISGYHSGAHAEDVVEEFTSEMEEPGTVIWTYADVVCALYRRHVKSATAQRATREFDAVEWNPIKGPEDLYSSLITRGQSMIEMPSQFVLKTRFIKALPAWISKEMRLRRGLTIEFSPLESIRSHARQIWETDQGIKDEEAAERPHASSSSRTDNANPRFQRERRIPKATETNPWNDARNDRPPRPPTRDNRPNPRQVSQERSGKKVCFSCGGDHYARDKVCPNYSEQRPGRDARVAAQRVRESYSDEESEEYGYEDALALSDDDNDHDPNSAPDLDSLIADSREEEVHLHAMREQPVRLQYYSMRIEPDEHEPQDDKSPAPFGNYNPGPTCIVCNNCDLVRRQVPATSENGLGSDQEYTVCAHLALAGLDPSRISLPESPAAEDNLLDEGATSDDEVPRNWLGDPDLPPGVLIDLEEPSFARSALDDVRDHDAARVRDGHPALTPLEFYINLNWVRHYRYYPDESDEELQVLRYLEDSHQEMREDAEYGPETRARDAVEAEEAARKDEERISARGAGSTYELDPALAGIARDIGERAAIYLLDMRISDRLQQIVITRQWLRLATRRRNLIDQELDAPSIPHHIEELWEAARMANIEGDARMSYELSQLESEMRRLRSERSAEQDALQYQPHASVVAPTESLASLTLEPRHGSISCSPENLPRFPQSILVPGHEELGAMTPDEATFWSTQTPFSADEMDRSLIPELAPTATDDVDLGTRSDRVTEPRFENWYTPEVLALMNEQTPEHIADAAEYDAQAGSGYTWDEELERRDRVREANQGRGWRWADEFLANEFFAIRIPDMEDNPESDNPDAMSTESELTIDSEIDPTSSDDVSNIPVRESYDSTADQPLDPHSDDEEILQSIVMTGPRDAELVVVRSDRHGNIYTRTRSLPTFHYLNPTFRAEHEIAMNIAIRAREDESEDPPLDETHLTQWSHPGNDINGRNRRGFPDSSPRLLPGVVYHERLASLDPEFDNEDAVPGFRIQFLAGRTPNQPVQLPPNRRVNNQLPSPIGLLDQPSRTRESTACITVLLKINGTEAFVLIDTGSTTNSVTPEFANATKAPRIKLAVQVTLQLGCVGSRSRINYGTRIPVDFGGIKGYVYFDLVNLDRYDVIIGTPFLNRHGIILDFGKRELRFPNGHVIPALPITAEAALISRRSAARREPPISSTEGSTIAPTTLPRRQHVTIEEVPEEDNELPSLPDGYARYMEAEADFQAEANTAPAVPAASTPVTQEKNTEKFDEEESEAEAEEIFFDCEEGHNEHPDETFCIECWNEMERESVLHLTLDHVNESSRTPRRTTSSGMPDISQPSVITLHSSKQRISRHLEYDQDGVNEEALEEVISFMHMRHEERIKMQNGPAPVNSTDRLAPLRAKWFEACADLMGPIPATLPPFREINHEINLVDEELTYGYHMPRCSDALRPQLRDKINRYVAAGWWEMRPVPQAAPLLCIHKKTGNLRTVVDARKRNENTVKDVTPFPDQDNI